MSTEAIHTTEQAVRDLLATIPDPEIPVINIVELGIVRDVTVVGGEVKVIITPTYSGCPATEMIETDIRAMLSQNGIINFSVESRISPAWTTDWITAEAREKLREYGIAPPLKSSVNKRSLMLDAEAINCPHCGSEETSLVSQFGSTPCKALYKCEACLEPFDYFKCL